MVAVVDGGAPIVACNEEVIELAGIDQPTFEAVCEKELGEIDRRRKRYLGTRERTELPRERSFSSMMASLRERRSVRPCGPSACASRSLFLRYRWRPTKSLKGLREDADEVVCLEDHEFFGAIGFYYADFRQVSDKEVVDLVTRFTTLCESAGTSRSDTANSVNPLATKCLCAEGVESEGNFPGCSSPARVFTGGAEAMWREPPIDEVVVTDAVPVTSVNEAGRKRLVVLQTADLFADVIRS